MPSYLRKLFLSNSSKNHQCHSQMTFLPEVSKKPHVQTMTVSSRVQKLLVLVPPVFLQHSKPAVCVQKERGPRMGCFWWCNLSPTDHPRLVTLAVAAQTHLLFKYIPFSFLKIKMSTPRFQLTLANSPCKERLQFCVCACQSLPLLCKCIPLAMTPGFSCSSTRQSFLGSFTKKLCLSIPAVSWWIWGCRVLKTVVFYKEHKEALRNILTGIFADAVCFVAS